MTSSIYDNCPAAVRKQAAQISDYWAKQGGDVKVAIIPANSHGDTKGQGIGSMFLTRSDMVNGRPVRWFK